VRRPAFGTAPAELLGEDGEIVAGRRPVEEAFAARREARRLLVVPERRAALEQLVLHATTLRIPVVEVEGGTITAVAGFDGHQGVALVVAPRRWATLDEVLALALARGEPPFLLALDHLEDPQNVGTLLRSAEACGVHGVIFPTRGAAPISPAAIKTSAGATEHLLLVPMPDLAAGLVDLHARGIRVIGADGDARMTVREADLRGPIVIVTGSEGRGLSARVRKRVDLMARIPMRGQVASLNASVAGSIFLFEAVAQREPSEPAGTDARTTSTREGGRPADQPSAVPASHARGELPAHDEGGSDASGPDAPGPAAGGTAVPRADVPGSASAPVPGEGIVPAEGTAHAEGTTAGEGSAAPAPVGLPSEPDDLLPELPPKPGPEAT
jgi:23S rRNA (guanosine2251-2'-O)-methyltransferase